MRREDDAWVAKERVVGGGGFLPPDVEAHAREATLGQGRLQGRSVDETGPGAGS